MNKHFATIVVVLNTIISIGLLSLNNWLPPVPEKLEEVVEQKKVAATLCRNCSDSTDLSRGDAKIDGQIDDNAKAFKCAIKNINYKPGAESSIIWIETKHLLFRNIRMSDVDALYAYARKPEVAARTEWAPHISKMESIQAIKDIQEAYNKAYLAPWGIEEKETGRFIGTAGICQYNPDEPRTMIEYTLGDAGWDKGYELEVAQALIEFCLVAMKCNRIAALARCDDPFSQKILERAGMSREGIEPDYRYINGSYVSLYHYALIGKEVNQHIIENSAAKRQTKSES